MAKEIIKEIGNTYRYTTHTIQEYLGGEDLSKFIKKHSLKERQVKAK